MQPLSKAIAFLAAPILNDAKDGLSLGRLLLFVYAIRCLLIPDLVLPIFGILAAYCFGTKKQTVDTISRLTGKDRE
jgi:hypothetical protein